MSVFYFLQRARWSAAYSLPLALTYCLLYRHSNTQDIAQDLPTRA